MMKKVKNFQAAAKMKMKMKINQIQINQIQTRAKVQKNQKKITKILSIPNEHPSEIH